jgi:hypothetical protein
VKPRLSYQIPQNFGLGSVFLRLCKRRQVFDKADKNISLPECADISSPTEAPSVWRSDVCKESTAFFSQVLANCIHEAKEFDGLARVMMFPSTTTGSST